jgi:F-type H+-transporting ATPase subunit a
MGLEFLARVRRTSLWVGAVAALMSFAYRGIEPGLSVAGGVVWSLVNLALLEALIVALTSRGPESFGRALRLWGSAAGMLAWFGAGAFLLARLSPLWLLVGFLFPYGVIVAKAASLLIVGSRAFGRLASHPRRSGALLAALGIAAWAAFAMWPAPGASPARATAQTGISAPAHGAEGALAADPQAADAHDADPHAQDDHGAAAHGGDDHGGGHGEASGPQLFPNFITVLYRAFPDAAWAHWLHEWEIVIFALLVAAVISIVAGRAAARRQLVPGRFQGAVELLFKSLYDFIVGILGEKYGPRYVPFLGTLFIYILCMNLAGLVPMLHAPTASLNVTVALAVTVFFYAQWIGFRELGVVGWLDHLAGNPRSLIGWLMVPLMLPIHVIGEFAKPISLAARLFGNIFGEDMLLVAFASLGVTVLAATGLPFGLPLHLPFMFMAILFSTIQALVFTVLSTIYFLLMLPHDHEHEHGHEAAAQHAH